MYVNWPKSIAVDLSVLHLSMSRDRNPGTAVAPKTQPVARWSGLPGNNGSKHLYTGVLNPYCAMCNNCAFMVLVQECTLFLKLTL